MLFSKVNVNISMKVPPFIALLQLLLLPWLAVSQSPWTLIPEGTETSRDLNLAPNAQVYQLSLDQLQASLNEAPPRFNADLNSTEVLAVPDMKGGLDYYQIRQDRILAPALAAKYPGIQSYVGYPSNSQAGMLYLTLTEKGLYAMVLKPGQPTIIIDPIQSTGKESYSHFYFKEDLTANLNDFKCHSHHEEDLEVPASDLNRASFNASDLKLYRLALACTGEYAAFHGGTKPAVLAAMVVSITRVNGIYERDFGIHLELIANNDDLIFLNPDTDPYTNGTVAVMLNENQQTCNAIIGASNYDIGHVYGLGGGGVASLSCVCNDNTKARGVTATSNPIGDPFDVDYVAHEMGHQFGCNHTFNNSCKGNRYEPGAWEPGSGSTIMAYAGICDPNVQTNSDAYFHGGSLAEAYNYTINGNGNTCAEIIEIGNQKPTVEAGPSYFIPHSTPFELTAIGQDPESDPLTYAWEQFDNQLFNQPPQSNHAGGPLFRSLPPVSSPTRIFPDLETILKNESDTWEVLPEVERTLNFRVTLRDNHPGNGLWAQDNLQLSVVGSSGPFEVSYPNNADVWAIGDTVTVTWAVSGTNAEPINCTHVDVYLSTDGGYTYPILLAGNQLNDGAAKVVVPNVLSADCRVKIKGRNQVFFDISNQNFSIGMPANPSFLARGTTDSLAYCIGTDTVAFAIDLTPLTGFAGNVAVSLSGLNFSGTDLPPTFLLVKPDTLHFNIWGINSPGVMADTLLVRLQIPGVERTLTWHLFGSTAIEAAVEPVFPGNNTAKHPRELTVVWEAKPDVYAYTLFLSKTPVFNPQDVQVFELTDTFKTLILDASTTYYWRVSAYNQCGDSPPMDIQTFRTIPLTCEEYSTDLIPFTIPFGVSGSYNIPLTVLGTGSIAEIQTTVKMSHSSVGDMVLRLIHPDNTGRNLLFRTCAGGEDVDATFSDLGMPFSCAADNPVVRGVIQPQTGSLETFKDREMQGNWILRIIDDLPLHGGTLESWTLRVCKEDSLGLAPVLQKSDTLQAMYCNTVTWSDQLVINDLETASLVLIIRALPGQGQLLLNTQPVALGDTLKYTDIKSGKVSYTHGGSPVLEDGFCFDIYNLQSLGWLPGICVNIKTTVDLEISTETVTEILCHGASTAQIQVSSASCNPPFSYRMLPNGLWQSNALFDQLPAGNYQFEVRDANDFIDQSAVTIVEQPDLITVDYQLIGSQITLQVDGGTPPYRYIFQGNTSTNPQFTLPASGLYTWLVEDDLGCGVLFELEVALLSGVASVQDLQCFEDNNGAIHIEATGGNPPYLYRLNNTGMWQSSPLFTNLPADTYIPEVEDADMMVFQLPPVTLLQPDELILEATQTSEQEVLLMVTGGVPPFFYQWANGVVQAEPLFTGVSPGVHWFYVYDGNLCIDSVEIMVETTSLSEYGREALTVDIIPNPSSGLFTITLHEAVSGPWQWKITDLPGREIIRGVSNHPTWEVVVPFAAPGMYFLQIGNHRYQGVERIILK
jgi:subtilisin-like proprotein convertase family protein